VGEDPPPDDPSSAPPLAAPANRPSAYAAGAEAGRLVVPFGVLVAALAGRPPVGLPGRLFLAQEPLGGGGPGTSLAPLGAAAAPPAWESEVRRRALRGRGEATPTGPTQTTPPPDHTNLWCCVGPARGGPHFDAHDNVLGVLRGRKRVALAPPDWAGPPGEPPLPPAWTVAPHRMAAGAAGQFWPPSPDLNPLQSTAPLFAEVGPGEALCIPAGWWHAVDSDAGTVAVNWWRAVELSPPSAVKECLVEPLDRAPPRSTLAQAAASAEADRRAAEALAAARRAASSRGEVGPVRPWWKMRGEGPDVPFVVVPAPVLPALPPVGSPDEMPDRPEHLSPVEAACCAALAGWTGAEEEGETTAPPPSSPSLPPPLAPGPAGRALFAAGPVGAARCLWFLGIASGCPPDLRARWVNGAGPARLAPADAAVLAASLDDLATSATASLVRCAGRALAAAEPGDALNVLIERHREEAWSAFSD